MGLQQMDRLLLYLYQITPRSAGRTELLKEVFPKEKNIPIEAMLLDLKAQGLVYPAIEFDQNIAYDKRDHYALTNPAIGLFDDKSNDGKPLQARETARLLEVERQQATAKLIRRDEWPKRHWLMNLVISAIVGTVFGLIALVFGEMLKHRYFPDSKSNAQITIVHDTVRIPVQQAARH